MILAAGRGTRLGELSMTTPKVLVDVGGEPLLARHLRILAAQRFEGVVVNTHHLAERVAAFLASYRGPLRIELVHEPTLLGTAGGVRNALPLLGREAFLVLYGDVLVDEPLGPLLRAHSSAGADATVAVYEAEETEGKGVVEVDGAGRIHSFVEKGERDPGRALVNAGIYALEPTFVEETTPPGVELDFGHDVFPAALRSGRRLVAHVLRHPVLDLGTPEALTRARARPAREGPGVRGVAGPDT